VSATSAAASTPAAASSAAGQGLGGIAPGTQNCAYNSNDGTYLATVEVAHTVCRDVASVLAKDGQYWWPVPYEAPAQAEQQAETVACTMTGDGMTMNVYDFRSNAPSPTIGGVAIGVCQKEEAAGWLPSLCQPATIWAGSRVIAGAAAFRVGTHARPVPNGRRRRAVLDGRLSPARRT
jgi:hypothetical protein